MRSTLPALTAEQPGAGTGQTPPLPIERLLTLRDVMKVTTLSKGSVYRLVGKGRFPAPIKLSDERIAWRVSVIARWMSEREDVA
jgi:prophage regulatory protein